MRFPVPGRVQKTVLAGIFAIWLIFALALNWGNVSQETFFLLSANADALLGGQVWRLLTAPWLSIPVGGIGDLIGNLIGLYFLGTALEKSWGGRRYAFFLLWTGILAYSTSFLASLVLPPGLLDKLTTAYPFGPGPIVYGVAIAWACSFRGSQVLLMLVVPISSRALIWITIGIATLSLIVQSSPPSGHIASFAGMGFGYLLGGSSPSPLRRLLLRYRLASLERQISGERNQRKKRTARSGLKVISGGKDGDPPKNRILH